MLVEQWNIAYRERSCGNTLLSDKSTEFHVIPNTKRYWCADPFVCERDGRNYIFAEMYDGMLFRGVIGYCELTSTGPTEWKPVIKEPHHLSYPFIFEYGSDIYMIPESYVANEISLYKAIDFPDKWVKESVLVKEYCAVDSTVFVDKNNSYILTLKTDPTTKLELFSLDMYDYSCNSVCIAENFSADQSRPAGKLFNLGEKLIRPAQDCSAGYGSALNFYEIKSTVPYSESLMCKIGTKDIVSDATFTPEGIHTYNFSDTYEVIDLKTYKKLHFPFLRRCYCAIMWRIFKLFGI